jgi:predicted DNA-binding transcriptional regulator AlpA
MNFATLEEDYYMEAVWYLLTPEMLNEFLTTEEASQFLKIGKSTLEQARLKGTGPKYIKIGPKIVRYRVDDIMSWGKAYSSTSEYEKTT